MSAVVSCQHFISHGQLQVKPRAGASQFTITTHKGKRIPFAAEPDDPMFHSKKEYVVYKKTTVAVRTIPVTKVGLRLFVDFICKSHLHESTARRK